MYFLHSKVPDLDSRAILFQMRLTRHNSEKKVQCHKKGVEIRALEGTYGYLSADIGGLDDVPEAELTDGVVHQVHPEHEQHT